MAVQLPNQNPSRDHGYAVVACAIVLGGGAFVALNQKAGSGWEVFASLLGAVLVAFAVVGMARLAFGPDADDKIVKLELEGATVRDTEFENVMKLFSNSVTLVPIFDEKRAPIFVIRRKLVPDNWLTNGNLNLKDQALGTKFTIDDYIKLNRADAVKFGFVPATATLETAKSERGKANVIDMFVAIDGQKNQQVLGWLPENLLA